MQTQRTAKASEIWTYGRLKIAVHWDAAQSDPRAYLTAIWSRLRGKKVRSRQQFAALTGRSRFAYNLWLLKEEMTTANSCKGDEKPLILALIDGTAEGQSLSETLRDIASEGIPVQQIGTGEAPTLWHVAQGIDWSEPPWLLPISVGDRLARGAAAAYRAAILEAGADTRIVYADDDLLDGKRDRHAPHFKPAWNSELFRHFDYLAGACVLRANREDLESCSATPDWSVELTERIVQGSAPVHLPRMLHHRLSRPKPRIPAAPRICDKDLPPVSIIVPTRNRADLLRTCLEGVAATDYPDVEVFIVDNDSDDPDTLAYLANLDPARHYVLRQEGAFNFSALNNRAAIEARGRLLCLLNNDIEVIAPDWLRTMAMQAQRDEVGAVGAQLHYPDGRIQHAGVVIGMGNAAGHAHRFLQPDEEGYFYRHTLPQFASAVTAACLVVDRGRFLAVGGLDEGNFAVAFNDVDLCLRLNQRGWQTLYEPRAVLLHHESVSRGQDTDPTSAARFAGELAALQRLWRTHEVIDPFHHPRLSRASEQFVPLLQDDTGYARSCYGALRIGARDEFDPLWGDRSTADRDFRIMTMIPDEMGWTSFPR